MCSYCAIRSGLHTNLYLCCAVVDNVLMPADYNPSDEDDCVDYTQKRIFAFRQVKLTDR
jgi:hypothetical protein